MKQPLQFKSLFAALMLFLVTLGASAQSTSFTIGVNQTPAQCPGTGRLTFSALTGLLPGATLSFTVYQGTGTGGAVVGTILTPPYELPNLNAGTYTVVATQTVIGGASSDSVPVTITIGSTTARPTFRPAIVGVRCVNDGTVTIVTLTGSADTYTLYAEGGTTPLAGPQASPTFSNLGVGRYFVRAQNRCDDSLDITVPIIQETTDIAISPYEWPYLDPQFFPDYYELDSCNTITVLTTLRATAPAIMFYPLTLTYTVTSPTGVVTVVTQTVTGGSGQNPLNLANVVSAPLPFYHDVDYYYDLLITDVCGNTWTRPNNLIHEVFTVQAQDIYDHCDEVVTFTTANYVSPISVRFVSYTPEPIDPADPTPPTPGSFDLVNDPILHNPNHPNHPAGPITYGDHMPAGDYCVELTDACGRIANVCFGIHPPEQALIATPDVACNATEGGFTASWARMITDFTQVHIIQPYPTGVTLPFDTTQPFFDVSAGIDPQTPSSFAWPAAGNPLLPFGTYQIEAVNECGDTYTDEVIIAPGGTARTIAFRNRPGCDVGYGSVQIYQEPEQVPQDIAAVRILSSTSSVWTAANPAAIDVSSNIAPTNGMVYMNNLPEGDYEFEITNANGCIVVKTVTVIGYRFTTKTATTTRDCTTFTATIDVSGANPGTVPSYWLQKWDPVLNDWVHPISGVRYPAGTIPTGQGINAVPRPGENSVLLVGPSTNNGVYTPGQNALFGAGDFRIIEAYSIYGNGVSSGARCITTLATVTQGGAPVITGVFSFPCSSTTGGEAVVSATGFTTPAFPNLQYSIIAKQGDPSFVPVGPQTSNVFTNLDPGVGYTFSVTDLCGTTTQVAQVQPAAALAITASGTCLPLDLDIPEYNFLDYEWFNVNDPATILSTTGRLNVTAAGSYSVRVTNRGNPTSCLNNTYTQVVNANVLPNAGTVATQPAICTSATAAAVDLTTYLTGEDAGGTFTQSASTPGGALSGSSFDISTITTNDTFDFTYTVTDSCGNADSETVTVTTTASPAIPTVNTPAVQCVGNNFVLTAVSTTPGVTYTWTTPRGAVTGDTVTINGALITDGGAYTVTVTNGSCTSTETVNVTVTNAPNAGVGETVNICNTATGTIESLETAAYLGASFDTGGVWTDASGNVIPNTFNTAGLFGQYVFTYTVTACGTVDVETVTLNLNATPSTPVLTPLAAIVCANGTVTIDTPAVTNASYVWTLPNNTTVTTTVPQLTVANADPAIHNGQYSLVVTVNNCPSVAGTATVTVTPLPNAGTDGGDTICSTATGGSLTLTSYLGAAFDTAATTNIASAAWTLVSASTPLTTEFDAVNGTFTTANLVGTYVFKYTVTSTCGAFADADVTIILNATPAQPTATAALTTVCEIDGSINLSTPIVTGASYQWFKNGAAISGATNDTYTISSATTADAADYTVAVTVAGCTSVESAPVAIIVTLKPQYTLTGNTILCPGQPTTITVVPTNNTFGITDANITYTWYVDGVLDATLTTGTLTNVTTTDDVTYTVDVTNTNGGCATRVTRDLTIDRNPFTVVLQSDCVNDHLILSIANISEIGATQSVNWTGPGVSEQGNDAELDITATSGGKGEYTVEVTNSNGCVKTQTIDIQSLHCIIPKGISPDLVDDKNDFFDLTNLKVENLQIFNRYGLQVYEKNNYTKEWNGQSDKGDLPTGTYFYVAKMPGKQVTGWVYIQRNSN